MIVTMVKCHICGKYGLYTGLKVYTVYSVHAKCEHKLSSISSHVKEFQNCSVCKKQSDSLSTRELRSHLIEGHSKEAFTDLIVNSTIAHTRCMTTIFKQHSRLSMEKIDIFLHDIFLLN